MSNVTERMRWSGGAGVLGLCSLMLGCGPEDVPSESDRITRIESALTTATFTLPLFVGQNPTDPVIAASVGLSLNDGSHTQEVGSVNDRAMISNVGAGVNIDNVGTWVGAGADCGTILSRPRIFLRNGAIVAGSVYQGDSLPMVTQGPFTVTGANQASVAYAIDTSWTRTITWPTTFNNVPNLEPNQMPATVPLAPGAYHTADVKSGRTLKLSAGQYFFDNLIFEPSAGLQVDGGRDRSSSSFNLVGSRFVAPWSLV